jgi:hypothetical protein
MLPQYSMVDTIKGYKIHAIKKFYKMGIINGYSDG